MIRAVTLDACDGEAPRWARRILSRNFPGVRIVDPGVSDDPEISLTTEEWSAPDADILGLDQRMICAEAASPWTLCIRGPRRDLLRTSWEILARYQRLLPRTNQGSRSPAFVQALERHGDVRGPSRAERAHELDTWQWLLRLDPRATMAVQLAALYHHVERDVRELSLGALGLAPAIVERAASIIDHRGDRVDPEMALLADADALSFFSLSSWDVLRVHGPTHTAREVEGKLARMRPRARALVSGMRLPDLVAWGVVMSRVGRYEGLSSSVIV